MCRSAPATTGPTPTAIITDKPRTGGRPTAAAAAELTERILSVATTRLLRDGFAATALEAVAAEAGVAKRTLYARFPGKEALALAVVRRLVDGWMPGFDALLEGRLEDALLAAARRIVAVALTPEALAIHRIVVAEAARFPALAHVVREGGSRAGVEALTRLLHAHRPAVPLPHLAFLAEQFQHLVVAGPQARAGMSGLPAAGELDQWCQDSVALFLHGLPD